MSGDRILIDTGAIYAFVTRSDRHHDTARRFVLDWLELGGTFLLPDLVFVETMTLLKSRLGAESAVRVGLELRQNPVYSWVALGMARERDTWALFQKYQDKDWSYTDCAILVLAHQERVRSVFAFDDPFLQMPSLERKP